MTKLEEYGYVVIPKSVSDKTADEALAAIREYRDSHLNIWYQNAHDDGYVRRVSCLHNCSEAVRRLFTRNAAAEMADEFFGEATTVYTSLYFEAGSQQAIHRDTPYFHTNPANKFLGVWVALEDADETNGALKVVP